MYKIPNDIIFTPDRDGQRIDYGYVRSSTTVEINHKNALIKIKPDWFWNSFKRYFEMVFERIIKAQDKK